MFDPSDTADLYRGPEISQRLLALLPLVGEWQGTGHGVQPVTGEAFRFVQQVRFSHDGRPFLAYESRAWLVDEAGAIIRPAAREVGFWRPGAEHDDLEVVLAQVTGLTEIFTGRAGDTRWDIRSSVIGRTATAKPVSAERRLYALVPGEAAERLSWVQELAMEPDDFVPHLNGSLGRARLER